MKTTCDLCNDTGTIADPFGAPEMVPCLCREAPETKAERQLRCVLAEVQRLADAWERTGSGDYGTGRADSYRMVESIIQKGR